MWLLLFLPVSLSIVIGLTPVPEPPKYILSFPTGPNPLNITVDPSPEKNYFILLGDWGVEDGDDEGIETQTGVAKLMKSFVSSEKQKGMNLLFVGTVGDNYYMSGQTCKYYEERWTDMYDNIATDYYWLSVWGNHDWGNHDPNAMCAWKNPKYIEPNTKIPYAANQLNKDKGGCNPNGYYQPDFGYYYSIPQLNFEWIAMDENAGPCSSGGIPNNFAGCGGSETVACNYMQKIKTASMNMMQTRANKSDNTNFMLINHYSGGQLQSNNDKFKSIRGNNKDYRVWGAGGHSHAQLCMHNDTSNGNIVCDQIRTGGGGKGGANSPHGFFVIGFDENKKMIQPYDINDPLISCMPPCNKTRGKYTNEELYEINFQNCCKDTDEGHICDIYDLSTCA